VNLDSAARSVTRLDFAEQHAHRIWPQLMQHSECALALERDGVILSANPAFARLHGRAASELTGAPWADVVAPPSRAGLAQQLRGALAPSSYDWHSEHVSVAGGAFAARVHATPIRGERGEFLMNVLMVQDVSAQAAAASAQRESEARMRAMFDLAAVGAAQVDPRTGRFVHVNRRYCEMTGYTQEELRRMTPADVTHPEDRERDNEGFVKMLRGEGDYHTEKRYVRKDARVIWVSLAACMIYDTLGRPLHTFGLLQDITERKCDEAELKLLNETLELRIAERTAKLTALYENLRESEQRYRALVELSPDAILVNQNGHIAYINDAGWRLIGARNREQAIGLSPYNLIDPKFVPKAMQRTERILQENWTAPLVETTLHRLDGSQREIEVSAAPVTFHGRPAVQAIYRDIGERKRTEQALRVARERLQFLLASTAIVIYSGKARGDYGTSFMSDTRRLTGYEAQRFIDEPRFWVERIHAEDLPRVVQAMQAVQMGAERFELEYRFLCADGQYRWMHDAAQAVRNEAGEVEEIAGYWHDVSERKRTEQQLHAQQAQAEIMQEQLVVSHTVAAIAHEMNQPLNAIASYNEAALRLLQAGNAQPEKLLRVLESSVQQAQRAGRTMRDLLATLETRAAAPEPIDLVVCVRLAIEAFAAEADAAPRVQLDAPPLLPRAQAAAVQVQKVLLNLLRNGAEAMHAAGTQHQRLTVSVRAAAADGLLQVSVRDAGTGVAAHLAGEIFQPLFTTKARGTGMGLAISRSLIEAQGGKLWLEGAGEQPDAPGACFHFTLPIAR
jgi:two-component system, LuxR family, sensor kinase FixL